MAELSSHNPSSPKITPKEEPVTLDKLKSPNPFLLLDQIEFTFEEIAFITNNEVALLYPSHSNLEYFKVVSEFIFKCCLKEAFTRALTQYKEYLCEFWVHYLPHSSMYVSPPSITIVRPWFATIGYSGEIRETGTRRKSFLPPSKDVTILYCLANGVKVDYAKLILEDIIHKLNKKTREKVVSYPRFISIRLEYMMPEYDNEELTINPIQAICNLDVHVESKAPKPSSQTKEVPQGKKPGAKSEIKRKQSSKHTSESNTEASKSKTGGIRGYICINTFRNALRVHYLPHSSMYVSPPSITIVRPWFATIGGKTSGLDQIYSKDVTILYCLANGVKVDYAKLILEDIIHKLNKKTREKALKPNQTEGPSFTDHIKAICNLDVHVDSKAPKPSSQTKEVPQGKKLGAKKKETQSSLAKDKSPSHPSPPTPMVGEMHKEAQQAAGGPTSLGATSEERAHPQLSSDQTKSVGDGLKTAYTDPGTNEESSADEISKKIKLEDLSNLLKDTRSTFFTPDSPQDEPIIVLDGSEDEEVAELKNIQWELPEEFLDLPSQVSLVQEKLKTLDSILSLLNNVTDTLNRFTTMVEHASGAAHNNVPSAGHWKIGKYLHFSLCSGTETKEGLWKELQFSLVDNSKLNVVYLLNRRLKRLFNF
nr:hypothetical protein [Tanacetum cinerariifolium]